ncbi:MAG: alpha/beta fold hydrolase [Myxococcota bacterium]
MRVNVNGTGLWFDVEGAGLVTEGPKMREKPTLILLHGGPGFDHSSYKPSFSPLAEIAQLVYLDHRGQGRSDKSSPEHWTLAQWADDVRGLCDALGIEKPIVFGQSFGGMVAMAYAARHPDHPAKLVFSSTAARHDLPSMVDRFSELGGADVGSAARKFWEDPRGETLADYARLAMPLYGRASRDPDANARTRWALDVMFHFVGGECRTMDLLPGLANVRCPTLVLGGEIDPVCPIERQAEIAAALPREHVRFERFPGCGHGVFRDDPERGFEVIRKFILD